MKNVHYMRSDFTKTTFCVCFDWVFEGVVLVHETLKNECNDYAKEEEKQGGEE